MRLRGAQGRLAAAFFAWCLLASTGWASPTHQLINHIASAQQRVWVISSDLASNEIATALYLARYRGLDVRIVATGGGGTKRHDQLPFLRRHRLPLAEVPGTPQDQHGVFWVLTDQTLRSILTVPHHGSSLHQGSVEERRQFMRRFARYWRPDAISHRAPLPLPAAKATPAPKVPKKARPGTFYARPFNYDRKRPEGASGNMPKRLPRTPIWQQQQGTKR